MRQPTDRDARVTVTGTGASLPGDRGHRGVGPSDSASLDLIRNLTKTIADARDARDEAIRYAVAVDGHTHAATAEAAGVSRGRVSQIIGGS